MTDADLRRRRAALNLSQKKLAEVLGVSKSTVAHWEQGVQAIPRYLDLALQTLERETGREPGG
jgi:transcriptional regulator with XRE-family HTH domain